MHRFSHAPCQEVAQVLKCCLGWPQLGVSRWWLCDPSAILVHFEPAYFHNVSDRVRGNIVFYAPSSEVIPPILDADCLARLDQMERHARGGLDNLARIRETCKVLSNQWSAECLLHIVRLCNFLRSDVSLMKVVRTVGHLLGYPEDRMSESTKLPSKATMSRSRFHVDCMHQYLVRERLQQWLNEGRIIAYAKADSSPRSGREFLFVELIFIKLTMQSMLLWPCASWRGRRANVRQGTGDWDALSAKDEARVMRRSVFQYVMPPVCMGANKNRFGACKFAGILFALYLLLG